MTRLRILWSRIHSLGHRSRIEGELEEEIRCHLQLAEEEHSRKGRDRREAQQAARRDFGNIDGIKESYRDRYRFTPVDTLLQDLGYAARALRKNPGFTAVAVLTLAIGIGANTAMITVINGLLLEPLPYKDPARLMALTETDVKHGEKLPNGLTYPNFEDWRDQQRSFSDFAVVCYPRLLKIDGEQTLISVRKVSANFFSTLGVSPLVGRDFVAADDRFGAPPTVILSYNGWQKFYGGAISTFEENLRLNGALYRVIGVLPRTFQFPLNADAYIPIQVFGDEWLTQRFRPAGTSAVGRLNPGVSLVQAQSDMQSIALRLATEYPEANDNRGASVTPLLDDIVDNETRTTVYLLSAAVGLVLLIACFNVANLLLARATTRQKEIAIRSAIGAGRMRIVRQLLTECLLIAILGAAAGLMVAVAVTNLIVTNAPLPRLDNVNIDWRVLAFQIGLSVVTGILFAWAPAWQAFRTDVHAALKEGGAFTGSGANAPQRTLIVAEVGIALVLLLAAGLVLQSTRRTLNTDPGFDTSGLWAFHVITPSNSFPDGQAVQQFYRRIEDELRRTPGIQAVSTTLGGMPKPLAVSPDYLNATAIHLLDGRFFDNRDTAGTPPVIVIDSDLANSMFPGQSAVGKTYDFALPGLRSTDFFNGMNGPHTIIGVVNPVHRFGVETDEEIVAQNRVYLPIEQIPMQFFDGNPAGFAGVVKSALSAKELHSAISATISRINPQAMVVPELSMKDTMREAVAPRQFATNLLGAFATVALLLAAVGIYGVVAYSVVERRQEIGIRMALGAAPGNISRMILRDAGWMALAGVSVGIAASFGTRHYIAYLLFDIRPSDPWTYCGVIAILLATALLAAYLPALRAMRLSPIDVLSGRMPSTSVTAVQSMEQSSIAPFVPSAPAAIEIVSLRKVYSDRKQAPKAALDEVSFNVEQGSIFGLIGQNGAGKTTLVRILLGLCRPTSGSARLLGCSPGDPALQSRIGYLPEQMRIPDYFNAQNFLTYMGGLNGVEPSILKRRIPEALDQVGLTTFAKPVGNYSKGMQQRLGLAQALINDPELLFLDEPTDGLDPLGRIEVRDLLLRLRDAGKTIFINSHLLSEVESVCDRILILNKGTVACTTTPAEFARGTGDYLVHIHHPNASTIAAAQAVVGPAVWENDALRFSPQSLDQLNLLLDALRNAGAIIISVEPQRISLEQFFIRVLQGKAL